MMKVESTIHHTSRALDATTATTRPDG